MQHSKKEELIEEAKKIRGAQKSKFDTYMTKFMILYLAVLAVFALGQIVYMKFFAG